MMLIQASAETNNSQEQNDLEAAIEILRNAEPECFELLWARYAVARDLAALAAEAGLTYDAMRMKVKRCRDTAKAVLSTRK